jgi:hypothetical protein
MGSTWRIAACRLIVVQNYPNVERMLDNCSDEQTLDNYPVVKITLNSEDGEYFLEKVINPPEPNKALREAFLYYQEVLQN